ncbi:MAG: hypothetical protein E5Y59_26350, partial [Mesorhizobium sp.]
MGRSQAAGDCAGVLKRVGVEWSHETRFKFLFMHVVIAKPLRTFARHALVLHQHRNRLMFDVLLAAP